MVIQPWLLPSRVHNKLLFKSAEAFIVAIAIASQSIMKVVHRTRVNRHRSHVQCHPSIATSLLLQPAPPPHHIQLKSSKLLIFFSGPSYSPRKSPRVAHKYNAHGMPPVITHQIPVIILHMVSLQQQHNNIRERTIICARESRCDAPTIDLEHIC